MSATSRRLGLAFALAASAVAAPAAAIEISFTGSIGIHIGLFPPIVIAGGGVAEASTNANGHITRIDMPAGLFATQALTASGE